MSTIDTGYKSPPITAESY